jgi:hypothetical protein
MATPQIVIEPRPTVGSPASSLGPEPSTPKKPRRFARFAGWLLLIGLLWCGWAGYALFDLATAVESGDAVALERRVDWLAVRQSLRDDLNTRLKSGDATAGANADGLSSERAIAALIRSTHFNNRGWDIPPDARDENRQARGVDLLRVRYAFFTGGPFAFRVDLRPDSDTVKRPLVLLFKWRGDWQLTRVLLPADAFGAAAADAQPPARAALASAPAPKAAPASAPAPDAKTPPDGAPHAILYEEDPKDPNGKRYTGWVVWSTQQIPPVPGAAPDLAVTAKVTIPDRPLGMTMTIRRNLDRSLPASHTIEVKFELPPSEPARSIHDMVSIQMKPNEEVAGQQLAGSRVKVSKDFFLIGLSGIDLDVQHNLLILKERPWLGIPFVYDNNSRAVLSIEKGETGGKILAEALARWSTASVTDNAAPKQ